MTRIWKKFAWVGGDMSKIAYFQLFEWQISFPVVVNTINSKMSPSHIEEIQCRGELSAVTARIMSVCLRSG